MDIAIERQATSFRLRKDLLEKLREKATESHRSLNNYVETMLYNIVIGGQEKSGEWVPDEETLRDLQQAREDYRSGKTKTFSSVDDLMAHLDSL